MKEEGYVPMDFCLLSIYKHNTLVSAPYNAATDILTIFTQLYLKYKNALPEKYFMSVYLLNVEIVLKGKGKRNRLLYAKV